MLASGRPLALLTMLPLLMVSVAAGAGPSVLEPVATGGVATIDRALRELSGHRRMLVVGAHPDDEDNALLSYVSRELGGEVAYLSLSRGEGGQNLIGPELGVELGILRTGELLAARELEDGRQFFARAYDFGYTRSLDETFARWPREVLQRDAVRVVRRFKPQVVVAVFPESGRAGHGQHQASAVIARDLLSLAGAPDAFPELAAEGLEPWTPSALYRRSWGLAEATLEFVLDELDPVTGRSAAQLAAASRSLHRSQDMGRIQAIGAYRGGLVWLAGGAGEGSRDVFDGIETSLAAIASTIADEVTRRALGELLAEVQSLAEETGRRLTVAALDAAVEPLAEIVRLLEEVRSIAESSGSRTVVDLVIEKQSAAERALLTAAGVVLDARVDRSEIPLGERASAMLEIWFTGEDVPTVRDVAIESVAGWIIDELRAESAVEAQDIKRWTAQVTVPKAAQPTRPYFLARPRIGDLYDWQGVAATTLGEPFEAPPLVAVFDLEIAGAPIRVKREIVYRYGDQALGEIRRPVRAVNTVEVELRPGLLLWRRGVDLEAEIEVVVRSNVERPVSGTLTLEIPDEWRVHGDRSFRIDSSHGSVAMSLVIVPIDRLSAGRWELSVTAELEDGSRVGSSYPLLEYPHVRPRVVPREASLEISVLDLELPEMARVGYVLGAADRVPSVLEALGIPIQVLSGKDLALADLERFDSIVIGSRAYETDPGLRENNDRLLEYVERGGTLFVQYQQYQFVDGGFAPFPLTIDRPHGRVTDETAPVWVLQSGHRLLQWPNAIDSGDWSGWIQERGLYFPASWHERYQALLAMRDPGREEERGALLVGPYGSGTYVYSGLSFFRQLPAGVSGAIRLFVNILGAGADRSGTKRSLEK